MNLQIWWGQIDWDATGSMLSGWGTLIGAGAVIWAATRWKQQKLAERRFELAERILVAAYMARLALDHVRQDEGSHDERNRAAKKLSGHVEGWQAQTPERTQRLTTVQVYYDRLNSTIAAQNELVTCLPVARAIYGEDLAEAITELRRQFHVVKVSAEYYEKDDGRRPEFSAELHRALCAKSPGEDESNEVSEAIRKAVMDIDNSCLQDLRPEVNKSDTSNSSVKLIWPFGAIRRRKSEK